MEQPPHHPYYQHHAPPPQAHPPYSGHHPVPHEARYRDKRVVSVHRDRGGHESAGQSRNRRNSGYRCSLTWDLLTWINCVFKTCITFPWKDQLFRLTRDSSIFEKPLSPRWCRSAKFSEHTLKLRCVLKMASSYLALNFSCWSPVWIRTCL